MDYKKIYNDFIDDRCKLKVKDGVYMEKHHIIPKSLGGSNSKDNIVQLTPSDHLFAHKLLAKIYNTRGMWFALVTMCSKNGLSARGVRGSRREYQYYREQYAKSLVFDHPLRGVKLTRERRLQISKTSPRLSGKDHPMFGRRHSEEAKEKMRKSSRRASGKDHSMFGRKHSEYSKEKMRLSHSDGKHPSIKSEIYTFIRDDGYKFKGTRYNFCKVHNISTSSPWVTFLIKGRLKHSNGWKLI